jgi:hypothetical protein
MTQQLTKQFKADAAKINELAERFFTNWERSVEGAIETGELLTKVRESVQHGEWLRWLKANIKFDDSWASFFMRCFEHRKELREEVEAIMNQTRNQTRTGSPSFSLSKMRKLMAGKGQRPKGRGSRQRRRNKNDATVKVERSGTGKSVATAPKGDSGKEVTVEAPAQNASPGIIAYPNPADRPKGALPYRSQDGFNLDLGNVVELWRGFSRYDMRSFLELAFKMKSARIFKQEITRALKQAKTRGKKKHENNV